MGERTLRKAVEEFCAHHHRDRNHLGLENNMIEDIFVIVEAGELKCRDRLGGLRYYDREAG